MTKTAEILGDQVSVYLAKLSSMADTIGARLDKMGGVLLCRPCGRQFPMKGSAKYLRNGWPKCCGETMLWTETKPDVETKP